MKRVQQDLTVALSVGDTTIDCRVVAVTGREASLQALRPRDVERLPAASAAATLVFSDSGGLVMLRGAMYRAGADDIRFAELGHHAEVAEQRRRAARLPIALPVTIAPVDRQGAEAGATRRLVTRDVSIGGVAVSTGASGLPIGTPLGVELVLTDGTVIEGTGRVVRSAGEVCGVQFERLAPADRVRLAGFLAAERTRAARAGTPPPRA